MSPLTGSLIPAAQRQTIDSLVDAVDLDHGDVVSKRSGFLIMLVLSGIIAVAGILTDSTATVIGAMIIAPLGTPILGIAVGLVVGRIALVGRSILWVLGGVVIVVAIGALASAVIADPSRLAGNSQITGRTSPGLLDMIAALATGTAGAFAMSRRDLSAVLPGVAIAISLVPPLGVVGVTAGQGEWAAAFGALMLFLSNVIALVIAGSIVFTLAGYARDPSASRTANRRRAYVFVGVLSAVIVLPLAANTVVGVALARWGESIQSATEEWIDQTEGARVGDVTWHATTAVVSITSPQGDVPPIDDLASRLDLPSFLGVTLDVDEGAQYQVR
jgi:uncharacterized hydrophobic protein (TIGR00271 family)